MSKKAIELIIIFLLIVYLYSFGTLILKPLTADYSDYELLINYNSGFIRRGLLGTILLNISDLFNVNAVILTRAFPLITYLTVGIYFFKQFYKLKISFLYLLLPFTYGYLLIDERTGFRDFGLHLLLILIFRLFFKHRSTFTLAIIPFIISIGILLHEMFFLYTVPIYILFLLFTKEKNYLQYLYIFIPISVFIMSVYYHGNTDIAEAVYSSILNNISSPPSLHIPAPLTALGSELDFVPKKIFLSNSIGFSRGILYILFIVSIYFTLFRLHHFNIQLFNAEFGVNLDRYIVLTIFSIQLAMSSVLMLIAYDWNRFINFSLLSALIISLEYQQKGEDIIQKNNFFRPVKKTFERGERFINRFIIDSKEVTILISMFILLPHVSLGKQWYLFNNVFLMIPDYLSKILFSLAAYYAS